MKNKFYTLLFLFVITTLTLYFPLRLHHSLSRQNAGSKTAISSSTFDNDAFYYLCIADNHSKTGINTYDGINPTNGYHFLWQNILNIAFGDTSNKSKQVQTAFVLSLLLSLAAYLILFLQFYKITDSHFLALFAIFPGFFYMLFAMALGQHYSPWSIINGLESGLTLMIFAFFLLITNRYIYDKLSDTNYYSLSGIILTLLILARLDEVFLLIAFIAVALKFGKGKKISNLVFVGLVPFIVIVVYLIYNQIEYGLILPVSGLHKSSFSPNNIGHIFNSLVTGRSFDYLSGEHLFSRVLPLLIPLLFVPLIARVLAKTKFAENHKWLFVLKVLSLYVSLKSLYILLFVNFWEQGYWYFFNQVVVFNLLLAILLREYIKNITTGKIISTLAIIVILIFSHSYLLHSEKELIASGKLKRNNIERIKKQIDANIPDGKIIEFDDGVIAYSSDNICLSGFGLCIDKQGAAAIKAGRLLDLAYRRGYRYIASLNYFKQPEQIPSGTISISDFVHQPFFALKDTDNKKWNFRAIIKDSLSGLVVIAFEKNLFFKKI